LLLSSGLLAALSRTWNVVAKEKVVEQIFARHEIAKVSVGMASATSAGALLPLVVGFLTANLIVLPAFGGVR
jgi:hypothetical protein